MKSSPATNLRRIIAGLCLMIAPALMLAADALRIGADMIYPWLVIFKLSFAFFVAAILAITHLLSRRADRIGLVGGALGIVGCLAGSGIVTASMIGWSIEAAALGESVDRAIEAAMVNGGAINFLFLYPLPGLAFPVGLLVLSFGLVRAKSMPLPVVSLLALGAILFPIGRIGAIQTAVLASGVSLSVAMGLIGWRVLKWSAAEWERVPPEGAQAARLEGEALVS